MKKKQWTPLEVDIKVGSTESGASRAGKMSLTLMPHQQYKDPPSKGTKKPTPAVPSHTRQRSENANNASAQPSSPAHNQQQQQTRDRSVSPSLRSPEGTPNSAGSGNNNTITEHHQVGGHEVTIKKVIFPAGGEEKTGKGVSVHGKIGGDDDGGFCE